MPGVRSRPGPSECHPVVGSQNGSGGTDVFWRVCAQNEVLHSASRAVADGSRVFVDAFFELDFCISQLAPCLWGGHLRLDGPCWGHDSVAQTPPVGSRWPCASSDAFFSHVGRRG